MSTIRELTQRDHLSRWYSLLIAIGSYSKLSQSLNPQHHLHHLHRLDITESSGQDQHYRPQVSASQTATIEMKLLQVADAALIPLLSFT